MSPELIAATLAAMPRKDQAATFLALPEAARDAALAEMPSDVSARYQRQVSAASADADDEDDGVEHLVRVRITPDQPGKSGSVVKLKGSGVAKKDLVSLFDDIESQIRVELQTDINLHHLEISREPPASSPCTVTRDK